ncbi:hypothetical protein [Actinomycetospora sp. TBRC 11914]|uniref:hypothetical protein n=1 Tax=Actinomycetospora sp. TBRC 11914 TaxID=2729387 RepID=UPI00145D8385|nr:hypothetical protein [Actinomycetospora sp. TBRC 11914]NMO92907.1 hypothetical protein [Actinomycetospora sp. TBRC 11914]
MHTLLSVLAAALGGAIVVATVLSAAQTLIVPRATPVWITRWVFVAVGLAFAPARRMRDYRRRDRALARYAPLSLMCLPLVWLALVLIGFALVYVALGQGWEDAVVESGSSLFTLGVRVPPGTGAAVLVFVEASLGLGLVALLVSYLPSIYGSYSRREVMVTALETQAGTPPSAVELLGRLAEIEGLDQLDGFWAEWTRWFADIEETHCSAPGLALFRSPQPDRSWVTAAGTVLDAAALVSSALDLGPRPAAELCLRSGYLALRRIADSYEMPYDDAPRPDDPIAVRREEFDEARAALAGAGAPVRPDAERAWRDFAGWRVTYDAVLLRFAGLTHAPSAPWSGDRPLPFRRPALPRRRGR